MIRVENLSRRFGDLVAVDSISFAVTRGEIFGLLGPNGAGKTTTLSMVSALIPPDSGRIAVAGCDALADPNGVKRSIGVAPQEVSLYGDLSAVENLEFFGELYGVLRSKMAERVPNLLMMASLADRAEEPVKNYSGGMKRRLNLVAALIHDPPVLLLDEPTVGVDPQSRNHLFETIVALKRAGKTVIYTTHYMEEAERLCDRIAIMDHGKILAMNTLPGLLGEIENLHTIRLTLAGGLNGEPVDSLPRAVPEVADARLLDNTLLCRARKPEEAIPRLLAHFAAKKIEVSNLALDRPSLETVFLHLTGHSLRD
ncbi:MAG: ATP-binding cassette domain-containing protein [Planctomycetes bacterium]|nr:ATP-binding cassette domain-containing protein [Planctomycetota bacterium]